MVQDVVRRRLLLLLIAATYAICVSDRLNLNLPINLGQQPELVQSADNYISFPTSVCLDSILLPLKEGAVMLGLQNHTVFASSAETRNETGRHLLTKLSEPGGTERFSVKDW